MPVHLQKSTHYHLVVDLFNIIIKMTSCIHKETGTCKFMGGMDTRTHTKCHLVTNAKMPPVK